MYLFQHIMYQRASYFEMHRECFLVIDTQVSTQHWVGRKKLRMLSSKICSCVGVNHLLLWRILNLFMFGGALSPQSSWLVWISSPTGSQDAWMQAQLIQHLSSRLITSMNCFAIFDYFPGLPGLYCTFPFYMSSRVSSLQLLTVYFLHFLLC